MFAAGFVSMVNTLVSGKLATYSELSGILAQHPLTKVSFQTNDRMWDFACKCVGKKYFIKIPQDFSTGNPKLHESIKGIFDNKGWPGEFFLADFLADYRADPSILERCKKLADPKKLENLRVNS